MCKKSLHQTLIIQDDGCDRFWFILDKPSKVKTLNSHVTACFYAEKRGCLSFL